MVAKNILAVRMLGRYNNTTLGMWVGLVLLLPDPSYPYTNLLREEHTGR